MTTKRSKVKLLSGITPLEFLPNLSNHLGAEIFVKRDDIGGRGAGGNKLRKYERIIGDAIANDYDTLIIAGHYQSNAARALVGAACQLGLKSFVVCKDMLPKQNESFDNNGNALLMNLMDATIISINREDDYQAAMQQVAMEIENQGGKPYIIPFGGSNYLGSLGYSDCAAEILQQFKDQTNSVPDHLFVANGSGGTQAGLVAGCSNAKTKVQGISVLNKKNEAEKKVLELASQVLETSDDSFIRSQINVDDSFIGDGYGFPTTEGIEAIKLLAKLEGIFLCPVYTGKAMAGLISNIKDGHIKKDQSVVFVHTGGMPLVHSYYNQLFE